MALENGADLVVGFDEQLICRYFAAGPSISCPD